jgi:Zn-dependent M28 family amino/carboxypeptidase
MKRLLFIAVLFITFLVNSQVHPSTKYAQTITDKELKELLYVYASDYFAGREAGTRGQKIAVDFLKDHYINLGINSAKGTNPSYFQTMKLIIDRKVVATENVAAIIIGSEKPNEYIIITSHLDHIGTHDGEINNGADDDGSGTVAMLEIAEAFKAAFDDGKGPKRSILFLHVSAEEKGLLGSKYYVENPLYPLKNTVANLNIDMIGRTDPKRIDKDPNYIYLIGADRLSQDLHNISEEANDKFTKLKLDYTFNALNDPNRFYYRSDHYNFAKNNIPIIFYFNGTHEDYHKPSDTVDKINYQLLRKRSRLIFYTLWELANREERIKLN